MHKLRVRAPSTSCYLTVTVLLVYILASLSSVSAQPGVDFIYVSTDGNDTAGCGAALNPPGTACLSIKYAVNDLLANQPLGASILINDGVYTGEDNTNIELNNPSVPIHIASINGPSAVTLDAEDIVHHRHFHISLPGMASGAPWDPQNITFEGITFKRGFCEWAGSIFIQGDATGPSLSRVVINNCVFIQNRVAGEINHDAGGAILVMGVSVNGSLSSALNSRALTAPVHVADIVPDIGSESWPTSPFSGDEWVTKPELPWNFRPAVIIDSCTFINNSFIAPDWFQDTTRANTGYRYAGSINLQASFSTITNCTFTDHHFPAANIIITSLVGGSGWHWIHGSHFHDNTITSISVNPFDCVFTNPDPDGTSMLISNTIFERNVGTAIFPAYMVTLLGPQTGSALCHWGSGDVTVIDTIIRESPGLAMNIAAFGMFRFYGGSISNNPHDIWPALKYQNHLTSSLFVGTAFHDLSSSQPGSVISSTAFKRTYMDFRECTFENNVVTDGANGGVFDLTLASSDVIMWLHDSNFISNGAAQGGVLNAAFTQARVVVNGSRFTHNDASKAGGVFALSGTETWFKQSILDSNSAPSGGAINIQTGTQLHIWNSTLRNNQAYEGGAILSALGSSGELVGSTLESNNAINNGGGVHDSAVLGYIDTLLTENTATFGGGLYMAESVQPLSSVSVAPPAISAPSAMTRTCSSMFEGVKFTSNRASTYGGGIMMAGAELPCDDFCTTGSMTYEDAQASLQDTWQTDRCFFSGNSAGASYGLHVASSLDHVTMLPAYSGTTAPLESSDSSDPTIIYPGLEFQLVFQLFDPLNRTYSVSGGGQDGVVLKLQVYIEDGAGVLQLVNGSSDSDTGAGVSSSLSHSSDSGVLATSDSSALASSSVQYGEFFVPAVAQAGFVKFTGLQLYSPPLASSSRKIVIRAASDRASLQALSTQFSVQDCPAGYVLFDFSSGSTSSSSSLLSCTLRPSMMSGDLLKVHLSAPLVLLACFVSIIGAWTTLILVEQIISARSRQQAYASWAGLAVLAFGFSGAWCMAVISVTSIEVYNTVTGASQSFGLMPEYVFGALAVLLVMPYLGIRLVFTDGDFSVQQRAYVKGLGKVNKYRQKNAMPQWQQQQQTTDSSVLTDSEESLNFEYSVKKNSLLHRSVTAKPQCKPQISTLHTTPRTVQPKSSDGLEVNVQPVLMHHPDDVAVPPTGCSPSPSDETETPGATTTGNQKRLTWASTDAGVRSSPGSVQLSDLTNGAPVAAAPSRPEDMPGVPIASSGMESDHEGVGEAGERGMTSTTVPRPRHTWGSAALSAEPSDRSRDTSVTPTTTHDGMSPSDSNDTPETTSSSEPAANTSKLAFIVEKALSVRIIAGVLVMFAGLIGGLLLMVASVDLELENASMHFDIGMVVGGCVVSLLSFYPALMFYLFLFTRLRTATIVLLVTAMMACEYMSVSGLSWTVVGSHVSSSGNTLDPSTMAMVAFSVSMVSCIVLIAINVVSLRLSRHQMSQVLKSMTVDLAKAHHKQQLLQLSLQEQQTWLQLSVRGRIGGATMGTIVKPNQGDKGKTASNSKSNDGSNDTTSSWLDVGVTAGLSSLWSKGGSSQSSRQGPEAEMLLSAADRSVYDNRPAAISTSLARLTQLELLSAADAASLPSLDSLPRITLEQVLSHPACLSFFLTHASRSHNEDSLLAYLSINQFRQKTDEKDRCMIASQIALDHLVPGSMYEVNIPSTMYLNIMDTLHHSSPLPRTMFDPMAKELLLLMQTNSWTSFVHTRGYWMCSIILLTTKHAQERKKKMIKQQADEIADIS